MTVRIGVNIHNKARGGQERSAEEKAYLPQFMKQLNPSAIVVMDDLPLAQALHTMLPNTIVVYRQYSSAEGHMFQAVPSPVDYVQRQRGLIKPGMPLYVMNEWDSKAPNAQLSVGANWMAGVMDALALTNDTCVIDNEGPGQPDLTWFTDDERWQAVKPLFDAFKRHPQMIWGLHPYWGSNGLRPQDGQSARHRDIERLLKLRGYDMPKVIFTEVGRDKYGGGKTNGWKSTGISEELYAAEILQARNELWTESYILGTCIYCYGSSTNTWEVFDIEQAKILHAALIGANASVPSVPPPPPIPAFPLDFDVRSKVGTMTAAGIVNVRSMPSQNAAIVDMIKPGAIVQYLPIENLRESEKVNSIISGVSALWQPVALRIAENGRGWVWSGAVSWKELPPFNEQALTVLYNNVLKASTRLRQVSLELASMSDDLLKDSELLDALIQSQKVK